MGITGQGGSSKETRPSCRLVQGNRDGARGRTTSADDALRWELVNKVVPTEYYLEEAKSLAGEIASKPPIAMRLAKEAVLQAVDTTIEGGLEFERKNFYLLFASEDQKERMTAFTEKRKTD